LEKCFASTNFIVLFVLSYKTISILSLSTEENKYRDGYLMGNGAYRTFYKKYYAEDIDKFLIKSGHLKLFKKKYFDKHLVRIMIKNTDEK
jgi:hypothetical protein